MPNIPTDAFLKLDLELQFQNNPNLLKTLIAMKDTSSNPQQKISKIIFI